jgi:hypothetical protein
MTRVRAWHVNVVGAVGNLGGAYWMSQTGEPTAGSLIFGIAVLAMAVVGTAAAIPSTVLFALGRLQRVAVVLNLLIAVGLLVAFSFVALPFGGFLVVAAALGWRESDG